MIQSSETLQEPRLWGLSVDTLHQAFWRSRGVHVVRLGCPTRLPRGAELYLLLRDDDVVTFDVGEIVQELTRTGAGVVSLRIGDERRSRYTERVISHDGDHVDKIVRRYGGNDVSTTRVLVTRSARHARIWMGSPSHRLAWRMIRRNGFFRRAIRHEVAGRQDSHASIDFLRHLVAIWSDPHRVLRGIRELDDSIWGPWEQEEVAGRLLGRVWLGRRQTTDADLFIGPEVACDDPGTRNRPAQLREFREIEASGSERVRENSVAPLARYGWLKRSLDVMMSFGVLIALAPVFFAVSLAVLYDDGWPILYGHRRQTRGGREFDCLKFRTMKRNAEQLKAQLASLNVCDGPQFYMEDDPRVTRVGRFLRRTHLDELPQFFNVFRGDMSLVGPRPSPDGENQLCPAWRDIRLSVRPGITGLWQVTRTRAPGRDFQEWIQYDIEYVRRASLWLDIRICLATLKHILSRRG